MARARTRWWCAAAALALVAPPAALTTSVSASTGRTDPGCRLPTLRASFGETGLDASHVDAYLVLTNAGRAACTLAGSPTVRFVTRSGAAIGNPSRPTGPRGGVVTLAPGAAAHALFQMSVPGVWGTTACAARKSFGLRVQPPGSRASTVLHFPGTVCSGRTVHESTTGAVAAGPGPDPGACPNGQLVTSLGHAQGAAGTTYVPIVFTDPVLYTCTLRGYPAVRSVTGVAHTTVGLPATDVAGKAVTVWVQPFGGTASAAFGVVETASFPPASCRPKRVSGIEVTAPHTTQPVVLRDVHTVCTHLASTNVSVVVPGRGR